MYSIFSAWNSVATRCRYAAPLVLLGTIFAQQPAGFESFLASAQQAQARGDFEAAAGFYREASNLRPEIAELKANLGLMYYQANKNERAAEAFQLAMRLNSRLFVPNLFLGLDYVKLKRFKEAIPYLKRAAQLKPDDVHVVIGLGEAYSGLRDSRLAIRSYLKATQMEPANADTWYRLGVSYLQQVEANARILLGQSRDSGYTQALVAENFAEQHAFNEAEVSYKKALSQASFPPGTHAGYGFVVLNHHDLPNAEREFKTELGANPGSLLAKLGMARLALEQGARDQCATLIAQVWHADPDFLAINTQRFTNGLTPGQRAELQTTLEKLQTSGEISDRAVALFAREAEREATALGSQSYTPSSDGPRLPRDAVQFYSEGAYRQCSDTLAPLLSTLAPKDLNMLVLCAYATGNYDHTFDAAERLLASATTDVEGLYWETKSSEKLAASALARASETDSTSPKLHVLLGDIFRQQQLPSEAEQEYRKALALRPGDTGALFGLTLALLGDSQRDEAFQVAQAAVKDNPDDPELNAVMGEILCDRDAFSEAEAYLKRSLNTKPEYISHVHALLGKVYANTNRTQEALAELKLALPNDKDGSIHYQIGRLYMKLGDRNAAKRAFEVSKRLEDEGLGKPLKDTASVEE